MDDMMHRIDFWANVADEFNARSVWSMWNDEESGLNPDSVALVGKELVLQYESHWVAASIDTIDLPNNPTWKQLYIAADKLIRMSGDDHHIFIEAITQDKKNPNKYHLYTGS